MFNQSFGHQSMLNMGEEIQLISLEIFQTRDYQDLWRRSYTCQLTGHTLDRMASMIGQMGADRTFSQIGVSELNSLPGNSQLGLDSGGIVRYSSSPTAQVNIANGWQTRRARFILKVNVLKNGIPLRCEEIVGYTDYFGITDNWGNAVFDPNMTYTIDSIKTQPYEARTGVAGMMTQAGIGSVSTVLSNNAASMSNPFQNTTNALFTTRPTDVFTIADSMELIRGAEELGSFNTNTGTMMLNNQTLIADTVLGGSAKVSNQKNDLPGSYTSRVLTNFYQTSAAAKTAAGDDFLSNASKAMLHVRETAVADSSFAFRIRNVGGTCTVTGMFTHAELIAIDPTIDSRTVVDKNGEMQTTNGAILVPPTSACATINATGHHQIIAHMIANTFLTLMGTHGLMMCGAICDNYTGVPRCVMNFDVGLNPLNRETMVNSFQNNMLIEVLNQIHASGIGSFMVEVTADVSNQIYLNVQLNGEIQPTPFVLPAFARSALTPVVTNDFDTLTTFAERLTGVVENTLADAQHPQILVPGVFNPGTGNGANW